MTRRAAVRAWVAGAVVALAAPCPLAAQRGATGCALDTTDARARTLAAPLDRAVSLTARGVSLRAALDRLGEVTGIPVAYASDLLPLDRPVCVVAHDRPLGQVLEALLAGTRAIPSVVAGRVVLVPQPAPAAAPRAAVDVLDRVVVSGNSVAAARRPLAIGVQVIEGEVLRRQSLSSLADVLDAGAAGTWMWAPAPGGVLATYAGIRGASSFMSSAPKVYLDGVELANPLLLTSIDPEQVDRIEVIRGPQGAALHGSDAIGGVVHVLTRHAGASATTPRLAFTSMAGASGSAFGTSLVPTHEQRVALRLGDALRSVGVHAQYAQSGAVFPSADMRRTTLAADLRAIDGTAIWTATARFSDHRAGAGRNPLLAGLPAAAAPSPAGADLPAQVAREYTLGGSLTLGSAGPWTHAVLLGIDGYRMANVLPSDGLYPVPVDSALWATQGSGDRTTLRVSSVGRFEGAGWMPSTVLTLGLDESLLTLESSAGAATAPAASSDARWGFNTGAFTQLAASWDDALFVSAGLRAEKNDAVTGAQRVPLLPMLGVAFVREAGPASLKLRAAYGRGIRPPSPQSRGGWVGQGSYGLRATLDPESQSGTELGAELYLGRWASLHVTRFEQLASGLIQNVLVGVDSQERGGRLERLALYQLQNVGEIGNHGWEVQATLTHEALTVAGALATVDSRVRTLASGYAGDLRPGDLMPGVPTRTASVTASWAASGWAGSLAARRAMRWVNYNRLALARDQAAGTAASTGPALRAYWMTYDGQTRLRATASRSLRAGVELLLVGENLLGGQLGEPDNVTIRAGRTVLAGLRAGF